MQNFKKYMHIHEFKMINLVYIGETWSLVFFGIIYMYIRGPPQLVLFMTVHQNKEIKFWTLFTPTQLSNLSTACSTVDMASEM